MRPLDAAGITPGEAASAAIRVFDERLHAGQPNATDYVAAAHVALHDTRGAVLATAEING